MEAQDRGAWPEDFGASTSTSRMRDIARRRREAEEKLALHLFATEPQLRWPESPEETATVPPVLPGLVTPARAAEQRNSGPEEPKAPSEPARTPE